MGTAAAEMLDAELQALGLGPLDLILTAKPERALSQDEIDGLFT